MVVYVAFVISLLHIMVLKKRFFLSRENRDYFFVGVILRFRSHCVQHIALCVITLIFSKCFSTSE